MSVSNEFKSITKKIKQQNIKISIFEGELTVKEIHMMPVQIFIASLEIKKTERNNSKRTKIQF